MVFFENDVVKTISMRIKLIEPYCQVEFFSDAICFLQTFLSSFSLIQIPTFWLVDYQLESICKLQEIKKATDDF